MTKPPKPVRAWMIVERSTGSAVVKDHRVPALRAAASGDWSAVPQEALEGK